MEQGIKDIVKQHFPILSENELICEIEESCKIDTFEAGTKLIEIGAYIKQMPMLIDGTIKVTRKDNEGNELLLYYLKGGETCAMGLTCCVGDVRSNIRATTLDEARILMLPKSKMDEWMTKYRSWKTFVLMSYQARFEELLQTIDSIAFMKMDERLENYLINRSKEEKSKIIKLTHQEIADDLNSSREVISRLLKQLEKLGRVKLHRFKVEILEQM